MASLYDFIDRADVEEFLENSPTILEGKLKLANEVVDYAKSLAPVDSGDYRDGIRARRYGKSGVGVEFSDPKSSLIEYGTEDTPAFAVRAKTIEHFRNS